MSTSEQEAVALLAKRSRVSEGRASRRLQLEKEKYETLRDFVGQDVLDAMSVK